MATRDNSFSDIVEKVKSWFPRRTEPANVSRNFWMPDHICRVCYECDSQFTIFNRKHHCRLCGRVFCAKCTANSIPVPSNDRKGNREEWERIRVCNFCFKQWEQERKLVKRESDLSPSSASNSAIINSSFSDNSNSIVGSSMPYLTGSYQCMQCSSNLSPSESPRIKTGPEQQGMLMSCTKMDSVADRVDQYSDQFGFCMNRSDDDDDEFGMYPSDSETGQFRQPDDYYGPAEFVDGGHGYGLHEVHSAEEDSHVNDLSSRIDSTASQVSIIAEKLAEEVEGHDTGEEGDAVSSIYGMESTNAEPVDFENNGLLWLPPQPENEEDERDDLLCNDDDDEDATEEWKDLPSSSSFGSREYRTRDRSSEEHKKAMKSVVGGYFRALVTQLLQAESVLVAGENGENWLDIITSLSWEAATLLKPDMSKGGGMDPGGYVKVKCIACGRRSESMVVKGVVCKKNVAHRRMKSKIEGPSFLMLGGALEYQRVANLLSSIDTLLQQEMDHLKMAVAKIDAYEPDVLLVEKSVSRHAQEYLLAKDISLVLNVKRPVLDRIARCTGAQIVPSIDHLSPHYLGKCETFHVEKFLEEHGSAGKGGKKLVKTMMFFEGCPKPLGCTVLLKGANGDELKKVKQVIKYGVFAAYHLALETSFLADEGASLPELPLKSPITVALPDKPSISDRSISTIPGFPLPAAGKPWNDGNIQRAIGLLASDPLLPSSDLPINKMEMELNSYAYKGLRSPISESDTWDHHVTEPLSMGPLSPLILPGRSRVGSAHKCSPYYPCQEKNEVCVSEPYGVKGFAANHLAISDSHNFSGNAFRIQDISDGRVMSQSDSDIYDQKMLADEFSSSDLSSFHQDNNHHDDQASTTEGFPPSPSDHQSILVSLSTRCVWKGTICERAHLIRIKYYGSFDKPLGLFLRDDLFDLNSPCQSCGMPTEAHVHCYTHRQGSLTISVNKLPEIFLPGEHDGKIWMWHRCLRCPRTDGFPPATRRIVMSDAAWGLSFGKFLELSFSNHAAASRVASCGHSLHRDCLRFYGFGKMVACFRYASIDVHSVYLPPSKLDFDFQDQEWMQKEANEVANKAKLLFTEVSNALHQIAEKRCTTLLNNNVKDSESSYPIAEVEALLQKTKAVFEESLQKALKKEVRGGQPIIDILEINRLGRQLLVQSSTWDRCLIIAAGMDSGPQADPCGSIGKHKEQPSSVEKLVEVNLVPKPNGNSANCELLADPKSDGTHNDIGYPTDDHGGFSEQDLNSSKGNQGFRSISLNARNELATLKAGDIFIRTWSEGRFPIMENLSDTFDAAWSGKNHPGSRILPENGFVAPDSTAVASLVAAEALVAMFESGEFSCNEEDRRELKLAQYFSPMTSVKGAGAVDDIMSWIYKYSGGSAPRFDVHGEYNPIYIFSLRDWELQSGAKWRLPVGVNDIVVPVYDGEPTSIISYALVSIDYYIQISDESEKLKGIGDCSISLPLYDGGRSRPFQSLTETSSESFRTFGSADDSLLLMSGSRNNMISDPLSVSKSMHARVSFTDEIGRVRYNVICYYAKSFDALRRTCCPSELDFVRSLSRCKKWGAQGGKSNVFFAKTLDDRFIIKQVTKTELESFTKFGPEYFKHLSESIGSGSPTCLAKIVGIYQVSSKHLKGGKESKMDVLVMENLLFRRHISRLYDLKGSSRSRYNPDSSGDNKVLLDQNLIEAMPTSPIFVGNKAKRLLERAVWNDTSFLASVDVMDYSLLVGVDEEKHELVMGIIDFMRQYTWDKHLETWVKASGILGGSKNSSPTVISPQQYKKRFRKAMSTYFIMVPDQWGPRIIESRVPSELVEENLRGLSQE